MATERVLVFDLWGAVALFRRFYTTASPLTFAFPPPTAIADHGAPGRGRRLHPEPQEGERGLQNDDAADPERG